VVFDDRIHAARHVAKVHATAPGAFHSPAAGPIGVVTEGRPRFLLRVPSRTAVALPFTRPAKVALLTVSLGDEGELVDGLADRFDGVVVAAFGAGHVPGGWVAGLEKAARRIPVVFASRTGAGATATATYGFPGSESDLLARGLIAAGTLDPLKARMLLLAHLRSGTDPAGIAAAFARF
jgi:L-asparaginase